VYVPSARASDGARSRAPPPRARDVAQRFGLD